MSVVEVYDITRLRPCEKWKIVSFCLSANTDFLDFFSAHIFDSLEIDKKIMAIIYHITNLVCYVEYNNYEYLNTTHV